MASGSMLPPTGQGWYYDSQLCLLFFFFLHPPVPVEPLCFDVIPPHYSTAVVPLSFCSTRGLNCPAQGQKIGNKMELKTRMIIMSPKYKISMFMEIWRLCDYTFFFIKTQHKTVASWIVLIDSVKLYMRYLKDINRESSRWIFSNHNIITVRDLAKCLVQRNLTYVF